MILANCRHRGVGGGGGGVTLIFSFIRIFWGPQNFEFLYIFRKMNIFGVLRFCEYFFFWGGGGVGPGHHNIGLYLGAISMHFRVFFKVNVQNGEYFFTC